MEIYRLSWKGYTKKDRNQAINDLKDIISDYGYIIESNLFSDMALSLIIETEGGKIQGLRQALEGYLSISNQNDPEQFKEGYYLIFFNVTFIRGTGNMTHQVPEFPG